MARTTKKRSAGSVLLSQRNKGIRGGAAFPVATPRHASISARAGRTLIRAHHTLQKRLAQALSRSDHEAAQSIRAEIDAAGGLDRYQMASINGQSARRGGDSSKLLMEWIRNVQEGQETTGRRKLRLLEVGCLSPDNAVAKAKMFEVTRIDLNSQHPSIEKQDFMERPLPESESERFDVVSLSLVLNYVPDPTGRGEMLRRAARFLMGSAESDPGDPVADFFPSVFLVLPAPCVTNSRYLNETRLEEIMKSIGYELVKSKVSAKLVYGLWRLSDPGALARGKKFKKEVVNSGKTRNNFAVILT